MLKRPHNLQSVSTSIFFNFNYYDCCEIDLEHINKNNRSHFSKYEVEKIIRSTLMGLTLRPKDSKSSGDVVCEYFVLQVFFEWNNLKIVFCICSDRPFTIGVITLFRT